tara:strand:+ start:4361 stop:5461 length:1101 start_codon:yes stop_codon:yes gene_type:complete
MIKNLKILIIGSTGELGSKLLKYCGKNKIKITAITGYNNKRKLKLQKIRFNVNNSFLLSEKVDQLNFKKFLKNSKINIVYFLDFGYKSIIYADLFLRNNTNSYLAIANKEMILAGGNLLIKKILKTKNNLIPLDSEHFSLFNLNLKNENIKKIFITASGGPFYFNKKINLNKVNLKQVLSHPKWKMGINNSIDSSNFVNKILEMYELSIIFKIDLTKIDFLISREAYIHSVVLNNDNTLNINCFDNDMLITLIKPLQNYYPNLSIRNNYEFMTPRKMKLEKFNDKRFKIIKYLNPLKKLNHFQQISFMLLNNFAQKRYLNSDLKYNDIVDYIIKNLKKINFNSKFSSFDDTIKFINYIKKEYDNFN